MNPDSFIFPGRLVTNWYVFQQTMFKHPREAQAILQEQVTYYMLRGGIRWAVKVGIVAFAYATMCQVNKTRQLKWGVYELVNRVLSAS